MSDMGDPRRPVRSSMTRTIGVPNSNGPMPLSESTRSAMVSSAAASVLGSTTAGSVVSETTGAGSGVPASPGFALAGLYSTRTPAVVESASVVAGTTSVGARLDSEVTITSESEASSDVPPAQDTPNIAARAIPKRRAVKRLR